MLVGAEGVSSSTDFQKTKIFFQLLRFLCNMASFSSDVLLTSGESKKKPQTGEVAAVSSCCNVSGNAGDAEEGR